MSLILNLFNISNRVTPHPQHRGFWGITKLFLTHGGLRGIYQTPSCLDTRLFGNQYTSTLVQYTGTIGHQFAQTPGHLDTSALVQYTATVGHQVVWTLIRVDTNYWTPQSVRHQNNWTPSGLDTIRTTSTLIQYTGTVGHQAVWTPGQFTGVYSTNGAQILPYKVREFFPTSAEAQSRKNHIFG